MGLFDQGQNVRQIGRLSKREIDRIERDFTTIVNVAPWIPFQDYGQNGFISLEAAKWPSSFTTKRIKGWVAFKEYGFGQSEPQVVEADEYAESIVDRCGHQGVFIPESRGIPSPEELKTAREILKVFLKKEIDHANRYWPLRKNPRDVTEHARWGAAMFGLKVEWAIEIHNFKECPACKENVHPDAVKCKSCGTVVDWQLAYELMALDPEQEKRALERGLIDVTLAKKRNAEARKTAKVEAAETA